MNALVVGGSSGIGLSIVLELVRSREYEIIYVVDKQLFPTEYEDGRIKYYFCNLSDGDFSCFTRLEKINTLFITAGFGHLSHFQDLSEEYITNIMMVNAIAPIKMVRRYYNSLLTEQNFICAIMVSIAGRLSSPLFSVYSASKAALSKFIEAINIELEIQGSTNRILEVSPGAIKGTGFNGQKSVPEMTASFANEIIQKAKSHDTLFIPEYDSVYKDVLQRYYSDSHQFGLDSYQYKMNRGKYKK